MSAIGRGRGGLGTIARGIAKLRGRSIEELRERAMQKIWAELELRHLSRMVREPSDTQLRALLEPEVLAGTATSAEALHRHFVSRANPRFFAGVRDGSTAAELRLPTWT